MKMIKRCRNIIFGIIKKKLQYTSFSIDKVTFYTSTNRNANLTSDKI